MMPGRRSSDSADPLAGLMAMGAVFFLLFMAWGAVIFFAATSWAFFLHVLRMWGAA